MDQKNIMFFENDDKAHTMVGLYLNSRFLGYKILTTIMILMFTKYYYLKKVIMNILLDIMM